MSKRNCKSFSILKEFNEIIINTNSEVIDEKFYKAIKNGIDSVQKLQQEDILILWLDPKNKANTFQTSQFEKQEIDVSNQSLDNKNLPPHHLWILVGSHIFTHSGEFAKMLKWLQKRKQKGKIIIIAPEEEEQRKKSRQAIEKNLKVETRIEFESSGSSIKDPVPDKFITDDIHQEAVDRWVASVSRELDSKIVKLLDRYETKGNSIEVVAQSFRYLISKIREEKNSLQRKKRQKIGRLKEEIPSFDWIDALHDMGLEIGDQSINFESTNDGPEETKAKLSDEEKFNQFKKKFDNKIRRKFKKECRNKIKKHLVNSFKSHFGIEFVEKDINSVISDNANRTLFKDTKKFLNKNQKISFSGFSAPPQWTLTEEKINQFTIKSLEEKYLPKGKLMKIMKLLYKLKLGKVAPVAIYKLLDDWGEKVYLSVLAKCEHNIENHVKKLFDWFESSSEEIAQLIDLTQDFQTEIYERVEVMNNFLHLSGR